MKKIVFASALALTLAGAVLTNDVFANDRLVATQSADGKNENVLSSEVLNPASGNVLVGLKRRIFDSKPTSYLRCRQCYA
ncbi:Choline binding protein D [Streptococcus mitis]|uniref:Choline binding protein D n=1 Tax=Streptococcus mitis TaxID=28037 RepID=A0A150NIM8_STRMT|nr:Choline binding protein D [Streptococcus mitis]